MGCGCNIGKSKVPFAKATQAELPLVTMLTRRVYTFYYPGSSTAETMIAIWRHSWRVHGWCPVVLTPESYRGHPMLKNLTNRASALPTVNGGNYELQCYLRWLAFDTKAPGVFTDFDVVNYGLKPEEVPRIPEGEPKIVALSHAGHPNPGLFVANQAGIRVMLYDFLHGAIPLDTVRGRRHTSDMYYFFRHAKKDPGNRCPNAGQPGWETAPCVHWSNTGVISLGFPAARRPDAIYTLRPA